MDGFDAMGHPIPHERLSSALTHVRDMMPGISTEDACFMIGAVAHQLEEDEPYEAMKKARESGLDLTGQYRLLAALLTDPTRRGPSNGA